jgi:hypothetical protein
LATFQLLLLATITSVCSQVGAWLLQITLLAIQLLLQLLDLILQLSDFIGTLLHNLPVVLNVLMELARVPYLCHLLFGRRSSCHL